MRVLQEQRKTPHKHDEAARANGRMTTIKKKKKRASGAHTSERYVKKKKTDNAGGVCVRVKKKIWELPLLLLSFGALRSKSGFFLFFLLPPLELKCY